MPMVGVFESEWGIIIILVVVVLVFGSSQIPKLARSLGSAQSEFKKGLAEGKKGDGSDADADAATPGDTGRRQGQRQAVRSLGVALRSPPAPRPGPGRRRAPRRRPIPSSRTSCSSTSSPVRWPSCPSTSRHSGLLLAAAGAFALLAVTARGPLGLARVCGPRLHATLDIVVALAVAAAPLVPALRPDITGIVVVEVAAVAWVRLATLTRYTRLAAPVTPAPGSPAPSGIECRRRRSRLIASAGPGTASPVDAPALPAQGATVLRGLGVAGGPLGAPAPRGRGQAAQRRPPGRAHAARLHRAWRKPPS